MVKLTLLAGRNRHEIAGVIDQDRRQTMRKDSERKVAITDRYHRKH